MVVNWIDAVVGVVLIYFFIAGREQGLIHLMVSLLSLIFSLFTAVKLHGYVGEFFSRTFGLPGDWTNVIGYILVWFVAEALFSTGFRIAADNVPIKVLSSKVNRWLGAVVSIVNGIVIILFILVVILSFPLRGTIRGDIESSWFGRTFVGFLRTYTPEIDASISDAVKNAYTFLTVQPQSDEDIALDFDVSTIHPSVDEGSESQLVEYINAERDKIGISPLYVDAELTKVAREYSRTILADRRFSHVGADGSTVSDRLKHENIVFVRAGENLAFAPTTQDAHRGLMNSEAHRINILDRRYRRVGVGVISVGVYGIIVTQIFAD